MTNHSSYWPEWPRRYRLVVLGAIFITTLLLFLPFSTIGLDPHHDGIMLKPAMDVRSGQMLFRDTFSQYGALTTLLQALSLRLLGPRVWSIRMLTVFMYAWAFVIFFLAWLRFLPVVLALLAVTLYWSFAYFFQGGNWTMHPWSSVVALPFQAATMLFLAQSLSNRRSSWPAVAAGASAALVFWCRQPVGLCLAGALFASLGFGAWYSPEPPRRWRQVLLCAGGFLLVNAIFLFWLFRNNALQAWFQQNILYTMQWSQGKNAYPWTTLFAGLQGATRAATFSIIAIAPFYLRGKRISSSAIPRSILVLATLLPFAGCLFFQSLNSAALAWGIQLVLAVLAYALSRLTRLLRLYLRGKRIPRVRIPLWMVVPVFLLPSAFSLLPELNPEVLDWGTWLEIVVLVYTLAHLSRRLRQRKASPHEMVILSAGLISLASWTQFHPVPDPRHVFWSLAPAFGVVVWITWKALRRRTVDCVFVLAVLFLPLVVERIGQASRWLAFPFVTLERPTVVRGMRVQPQIAARVSGIYENLEAYRRLHPEKPMLIESEDALYGLFVDNLKNPGPYYVVWGDPDPAHRKTARMAFIEKERPIVFGESYHARDELVNGLLARGNYVAWRHRDEDDYVLLVPRESLTAIELSLIQNLEQ